MALTLNGSNNTIAGLAVGGLPDGIVDNDMIANTTIAEGKLAANVNTITEADLWRIHSTFESAGAFLTSNWERADETGAGYIGTGMSQSSGVFSFPSTGIWNIRAHWVIAESGQSIRYAGIYVHTTTNNSSYAEVAIGQSNLFNDGTSCWASGSTSLNFDVTDTSNCKIKFNVSSQASLSWIGASTGNYTHVVFTRLGDT